MSMRYCVRLPIFVLNCIMQAYIFNVFIISIASPKLIVGRPHIFDVNAHALISESLIFPSTHIIVPKYAVTYFFSSLVIFEIVTHASAGESFNASIIIECVFSSLVPKRTSSRAINAVSSSEIFPSASATTTAILKIALSSRSVNHIIINVF